MNNNIPCIDCITLAICKGRIDHHKDVISEYYEDPYFDTQDGMDEWLYIKAIIQNANESCTLLKEYLYNIPTFDNYHTIFPNKVTEEKVKMIYRYIKEQCG